MLSISNNISLTYIVVIFSYINIIFFEWTQSILWKLVVTEKCHHKFQFIIGVVKSRVHQELLAVAQSL